MSRPARTFLCGAALLLSVAALPLTSKASTLTIYSNFNSNPSNLYNSNVGWAELGGNPLAYISAMAFTPGASYDLTQIDLAMLYAYGTNSFTLDLETGNGGVPSNTILQSWTVNNMPASGSCCGVDTVTSPGIHLTGGDPYWLVVQVPSHNTRAAWNWNNTGAKGNVASSQNGGSTWQSVGGTLGAFDVLGHKPAVPEPSVAALLGTALAAFLVFFPLGFSTPAREEGPKIPILPDQLGTSQPCPPRRCGL